jgi:hypothetical protein
VKKLYLLIAFGILALQGCQSQLKEPMNYQDSKYKDGQQWYYQTRKGEED